MILIMDCIIYTGQDSSDYTAVSSDKIFVTGSTNGATRCVNITIIDDNALEGEQTFSVILTTEDSAIILGIPTAIVTIQDDDG